jgi:predicted kinase
MAYLYILCGYSFTGKTTLARALQERFGFLRIDMDEINSAKGVGFDEKIAPEEWDRTYAEAYRQLDVALSQNRSVLFDAMNFTREQRDKLRAIAAHYGISSIVIFMNVSAEEARQRWLTNRKTHQRYDVRDEDFEYGIAHFEPPQPDEPVLRYNPNEPVDQWIEKSLDYF